MTGNKVGYKKVFNAHKSLLVLKSLKLSEYIIKYCMYNCVFAGELVA